MEILSYHGKSEDICRWVIETYDNEESLRNNITTQLWVDASKKRLAEIEQTRFNSMMHVILGNN